jgi:bacillolysin
MRKIARPLTVFLVALGLSVASGSPVAQESAKSPLTAITATGGSELRSLNMLLESMVRDGNLRLRKIQDDPMVPGHRTERYDQYFKGVRVWGADLVRVVAADVPQTMFGMLAGGISISVDPKLTDEDVAACFVTIAGAEGRVLSTPELVILPTDLGNYRLTYRAVVTGGGAVESVFIDANTGVEVLRISEIKTQTPAVGQGTGVLGDKKKISVNKTSSAYVASDELRPPSLETYDMRFNLSRALGVVNYNLPLYASDYATDADNDWTDVAVVDAHVHTARTYDYFYKRFGRSGFDDHNHPLVGLVNAVSQQGALTMPSSLFGTYAINAFFCETCGPNGIGLMYFGNGIPPAYYATGSGQHYTYLAGGLDIVAHELTHGVTDHSSQLVYRNESGALSEAFSDMMGTSVEFYYQSPGADRGQADYVIGEDVITAHLPGTRDGIRSMQDPSLFQDPDHYSKRYLGSQDGGGVHTNSGIANNAFYLAIEGGANRTSGRVVQGVGPANREQIEKVFYRGFVYLLPSNALFTTARAATIQAARDIYGAGSAAERAITQAWDAVGVF